MTAQDSYPVLSLDQLALAGVDIEDEIQFGCRVAVFLRSDSSPVTTGDRVRFTDSTDGVVVEVTDVQETAVSDVTWTQVEAEGGDFSSVAAWQEEVVAGQPGTSQDLLGASLVWIRFEQIKPRPLVPARPTAEDLQLPAGYRHVYSGKVRDLFISPDGNLLLVASDRISAYDWVLSPAVPQKGAVLTQMSLWWFSQLADVVPNHVITDEVPAGVKGRAVECRNLEIFPVECVVRGYLTGSGLADYHATGSVCGVQLPDGLRDGDRLPEPIFTPATKAAVGDHDENIDFDRMSTILGSNIANKLRDLSLTLYSRAEKICRERGIVLADTKFEFGQDSAGTVVLADEVLTPDSSRFWPLETWEPGKAQQSFDKQFARDWLTSPESGWDRNSGEPPPPLPQRVVEQTASKYREAFRRLTGMDFPAQD